MLRSLLAHADDDQQTAALARDGGRAFVSQSLRPYLVAALLDRDPGRPAIVVAGDDRAARDLAAGLRAWLDPRTVRYYPSRGVTYESHLAPPPHLVGLRIAALDALIERRGRGRAGRRRQRGRAVREGPRPVAPPARVRAAGRASCSTSTRPRMISSPPATSGSTRSRTGASSRSAAGCSTCSRRPRTAPSGSTCSATRSSRCAGSRPSPSARSATPSWSRSRPPPSSRPEHRELAEIAALEDEADRPDIAELLPVEDFHPFLELAPADAAILIAGEEDVTPALARPLAGRVRRVPRRGRPPPVRRPGRDRRTADRAGPDPTVEHRPGPAVLVPGPDRGRRRPAGSRRPSPSSRSSRARTTGRWSRSRAGARASGSRTTSAASKVWLAGSGRTGDATPARASPGGSRSPRRGCRRASSRRSSTSR